MIQELYEVETNIDKVDVDVPEPKALNDEIGTTKGISC